MILVTGSSGLIGSEACIYFCKNGYEVHGIDNNLRMQFFGPHGDTRWRLKQLQKGLKNFTHYPIDIRDRSKIIALVRELRPKAIIHTAAQPSHDKASEIPFDDFDVNAVGTLNLLEACRQFCPEAPFIHMSTNKVYGDGPNKIDLDELNTRWDYAEEEFKDGIPESFSIDQCKHSLFGASKVAADIMVQEYGRYFGIPTCCLRGGCLTGPSHSGVQLHGFLNYLVGCNIDGKNYNIFGYKGKQVRDNIHSSDVIRFMHLFIDDPKVSEVYNIGGGKENSCSVIEAIQIIEAISEKKQKYTYTETNRNGDHICYYSNLSKIRSHFPNFTIKHKLREIIEEIIKSKINKNS